MVAAVAVFVEPKDEANRGQGPRSLAAGMLRFTMTYPNSEKKVPDDYFVLKDHVAGPRVGSWYGLTRCSLYVLCRLNRPTV